MSNLFSLPRDSVRVTDPDEEAGGTGSQTERFLKEISTLD